MPISDDDLLEANAAVIAGTLIFLTISSSLALTSNVPITIGYLAILVIGPFALSEIELLRYKRHHESKVFHQVNKSARSLSIEVSPRYHSYCS
jgi:hypothetical protein